MTEPQHDPQHAAAEPEPHAEPTQTNDAAEATAVTQKDTEARDQLAAATTRGDQLAELLLTRSIEHAASDVLVDVTDLPRDGDYYAEDGTPDLIKIRDAARTLAHAKPHLAQVAGTVHQGAKTATTAPSWSDIMRGALG